MPNKGVGLEVLPPPRLPILKVDTGAIAVVAGVDICVLVASEAVFPKLPNGLVPAGLIAPAEPNRVAPEGAEDAAALPPPRGNGEVDAGVDVVGVEPNRFGLCCCP